LEKKDNRDGFKDAQAVNQEPEESTPASGAKRMVLVLCRFARDAYVVRVALEKGRSGIARTNMRFGLWRENMLIYLNMVE
jgi:hypothetical protein